MLIDIQITAGLQIQIECAVPGNEFQHVIEKADSRTDASFAATVQVQAEPDIGLVGLTMNFCGSWHYSALSRIALVGRLPLHARTATAFSCAGKFSARARSCTSRAKRRKPL